jgi:hypothetical protein
VTQQPATAPDIAYDDLRALFVNCTLKRSPEPSNTQGLVDISRHIMEAHGVQVDVVRAIDHDIATGVWPDMREHGWEPTTGRDLREGPGRRHPGAGRTDLAR